MTKLNFFPNKKNTNFKNPNKYIYSIFIYFIQNELNII